MNRRVLTLTAGALMLSTLLLSTGRADPQAAAEAQLMGPTRLDPFKALHGTWEGTAIHHGGDPEQATVTYRTTSAGSAVIETLFKDTPKEMVSVIYLDEGIPTLVHYCAIANQPKMVASEAMDGNQVVFEFVDGANIESDQAMHMHRVIFTFVDDDHFKAEWVLYNQGEAAGKAELDLRRVVEE